MNDDRNDDRASARALELVKQAIEILLRAEKTPTSPVPGFATAKMRRELRRNAARLRQGQTEPRCKNLHTAEQLADVYERTAHRDEMVEQGVKDLKRIGRELRRIVEQKPPGLQKTMEAFVREVKQAAEEQGPRSEAARRYWHVLNFAETGSQRHSDSRRRRSTAPPPTFLLPPDRSVLDRYEQSAAEILTALPSPDAAVIPIPPQGGDPRTGRMLLRIGTGERKWIGSFACGHARGSTVTMLPDGKHLFVVARGAGYVIDAKSHTLVERTGMGVAGTIEDEPFTVLIVDHDGMSLEAFGTTGRIWKTGPISAGGFRRLAITAGAVVGEARHPAGMGWVAFSVRLATGEVGVVTSDGRL